MPDVAHLASPVGSGSGLVGPGLSGVAHVLVGGVVTWCVMSAVILQSPLVDWLVTKDSKGVTRLDVVERATGLVHALVSGCIGIYAWTAMPVGACTYNPAAEQFLRFGVAFTMSYIIYDQLLLVLVEAVYRVRDVWWTMWAHHVNILTLFGVGLAYNQMSWFLAAHLINEVSSVPINLCYFMKNHRQEGTPAFMAMGGLAVLTFTVLRILLIPAIGYMFYKAGSCTSAGNPPGLVALGWTVIAIHWMLNCYWYGKMLSLVCRKKRVRKSVDEEKLPLIASEAGLGPAVPAQEIQTVEAQLRREEEDFRGR